MQRINPPREINSQSVAEYVSAREEMMERIKLRDAYIAIYVGAVASVYGVAAQNPPTTWGLVLLTPYLSLLGLALNMNHTAVIGHLVGYLRSNFPTGWDASDYWQLLKSQATLDDDRPFDYVWAVKFRRKIFSTMANGVNWFSLCFWFLACFKVSDKNFDFRWQFVPIHFLLILAWVVGVVLCYRLSQEFKLSRKYDQFLFSQHIVPMTKAKGRVLVTGASGYIGKILVHHLAAEGFEVIALDKNITIDRPSPAGVVWFQVDCSKKSALYRYLDLYQPNVIANLAGYGPELMDTPGAATEFLRVAYNLGHYRGRGPGSPYIIHASTSMVYPNSDQPHTEDGWRPEAHQNLNSDVEDPARPSTYQRVHRTAEMCLMRFYRSGERKLGILRMFNVAGAALEYGLGEERYPQTRLIPVLVRACIDSDAKVCRRTSTDDSRDYVHVLDVCSAFSKLIYHFQNSESKCEVLNVCTGVGTKVSRAQSVAEEICGSGFLEGGKLHFSNATPDSREVPFRIGSTQRIESVLGWKPRRDVASIIRSEFGFQSQIQRNVRNSESERHLINR